MASDWLQIVKINYCNCLICQWSSAKFTVKPTPTEVVTGWEFNIPRLQHQVKTFMYDSY